MCHHSDTDRMRRLVRRLHIFDQRILLHTGVITLLLLSNCSTNEVNVASLHVKSPAIGEKQMVLKSSYMVAKTLSLDTGLYSGGTVGVYDVFIANYDLETKSLPLEVNKPSKDGEILVTFNLVAHQGSSATSPTLGTYLVGREHGPMGMGTVEIISHQGGATQTKYLTQVALPGSVTIKSLSDKMILGEINLTTTDSFIKGAFNSWILEAKGR